MIIEIVAYCFAVFQLCESVLQCFFCGDYEQGINSHCVKRTLLVPATPCQESRLLHIPSWAMDYFFEHFYGNHVDEDYEDLETTNVKDDYVCVTVTLRYQNKSKNIIRACGLSHRTCHMVKDLAPYFKNMLHVNVSCRECSKERCNEASTIKTPSFAIFTTVIVALIHQIF